MVASKTPFSFNFALERSSVWKHTLVEARIFGSLNDAGTYAVAEILINQATVNLLRKRELVP